MPTCQVILRRTFTETWHVEADTEDDAADRVRMIRHDVGADSYYQVSCSDEEPNEIVSVLELTIR